MTAIRKIPFFVLLLSAVLLVLLFVREAFGFDGLYSQDSYEYLRYSKAIGTWFGGGEHPGDYFWASLYPLAGTLLTYVLVDPIFALQFLSALGGVLIIVYAAKLIQLLNPLSHTNSIKVFVIVGILLSPYLFRMMFCSMTDTLSIGVMMISLFYSVKYIQTKEVKALLFAVVLSTIAFNLRYATGIVLVLPMAIVFMTAILEKHILPLLVSFIVGVGAFVPHLVLKEQESLAFLSQQSLSEWSIVNFFESTHVTQYDGTLQYSWPNIVMVMQVFIHPGFIVFGLLVLIFVPRRKPEKLQRILLFSIVIYLLFVAGMNLQNQRFLLTVSPIILILLYPAWEKGLQWFKDKVISQSIILLVGMAVIQLFLIVMAMKPFLQMSYHNRQLVQEIDRIQGKVVYTLGMEGALRAYSTKEVYSLWFADKEALKDNYLIVVNEVTMKQVQVKDDIIQAFRQYKKKNKLSFVKKLQGNWIVYRVKP